MSTTDGKLLALNLAQLKVTRNDLGKPARQAAIEAIETIVATMTDLGLAARQAHWNLRGPSFSPLRDLFERISRALDAHTDTLAERAAALGGIPRATVQHVAATTKLKPYPSFCIDGSEHIEALSQRMAMLGTELRQSIADIDRQADPVTAHVLTEACVAIDKLLWLLESQSAPDAAGRYNRSPA